MTSYKIAETFLTVQGEGVHTGRAAVFLRFATCNLWTGRERDRARAICQFCDTNFAATEHLTLNELVDRAEELWGDRPGRFVVLTGGEPALQIDQPLIDALRDRGFYIAIETNGTRPLPAGIDWVCVSPKAGTVVVVDKGDELKLVYPQDMDVDWWRWNTSFGTYWLSPMDGPALRENTAAAVEYVLADPAWRLNTQTHKQIGVR